MCLTEENKKTIRKKLGEVIRNISFLFEQDLTDYVGDKTDEEIIKIILSFVRCSEFRLIEVKKLLKDEENN